MCASVGHTHRNALSLTETADALLCLKHLRLLDGAIPCILFCSSEGKSKHPRFGELNPKRRAQARQIQVHQTPGPKVEARTTRQRLSYALRYSAQQKGDTIFCPAISGSPILAVDY